MSATLPTNCDTCYPVVHLLANRMRIDGIAAIDDKGVGLGEGEVRQVADMGVERRGENLSGVRAD